MPDSWATRRMRKVFWMLRACAPFPQGSHLLSDGDCWKAIVTESQPILVRSFLFYPFLLFSILFTYEFAIEIQSEKVQILLRRFDADAAHTRTWALNVDLTHPFPLPASWLIDLIEESAPKKQKKHKTTSWIFAKGHPNWFSEDKKVSHEQGIPLWPMQMTEGNHWLLSSALGNSPPMAMDLMFPHYNHEKNTVWMGFPHISSTFDYEG